MAKISIKKGLSSAIYGAFDIGMNELDAWKGWKDPFKNATDISRTIVFLGSGIANYFGFETEYSEALFYSSIPLLEKSVYNAVRKFVKERFAPKTASELGFRREAPAPAPAQISLTKITSY
jgi:hypothetical protein